MAKMRIQESREIGANEIARRVLCIPMSHPKLNWAVARFVLKLATADELIDAAHVALDEGYYSYGLGELATQRAPSMEDSNRWFSAALVELDIKTPTREECVELMLEEDASAIVEGRSEPEEVLQRLYRDENSLTYPRDRSVALFDSMSLGKWADHYHGYDGCRDYLRYYLETGQPTLEAQKAVDDAVAVFRQFAECWLFERTKNRIRPDWRTSSAVGLAKSICEEQAFDRLPILADALEDAGCEDFEMLNHLRFVRDHVQTCWVAEMLQPK